MSALQEQVLVAAFPDTTPEVHLACLDPDKGVLGFREASVRPTGDVSLGASRTVQLAEAGSLDVNDQVVAVLGRDGRLLVQMHFESAEDQDAWAEGIRGVIGAKAQGGSDSGGETDVRVLQARTRQLQSRVGDLEAVSERRDKQLAKLLKRLDGAMQMLSAVQDMCSQQRKVIDAQKVAIVELRQEGGTIDSKGVDGEAVAGAGSTSQPSPTNGSGAKQPPASSAGAAEPAGEADDDEDDDDEDEDEEDDEDGDDGQNVARAEAEIAAKAEQMLALLQQADKMQRALQQLEAMGPPRPAAAAPAAAAARPPPDQASASTSPSQNASTPSQGGGDGDDAAALRRLHALEEEKRRYEGMLQQSQQEHDDLMKKMNDMRSLMEALGAEDGAGSGSGDDGESADGTEAS